VRDRSLLSSLFFLKERKYILGAEVSYIILPSLNKRCQMQRKRNSFVGLAIGFLFDRIYKSIHRRQEGQQKAHCAGAERVK
jgi:hypothetical protein